MGKFLFAFALALVAWVWPVSAQPVLTALYLVPVVNTPGPNGQPFYEPKYRAEIRSLPGWRMTTAKIPIPRPPVTIVMIRAASFAALDVLPDVVKLGEGTSTRAWMDADTTARAIPANLASRLTAMGASASGTVTRRQLYRRIMQRLEPACATADDCDERPGAPEPVEVDGEALEYSGPFVPPLNVLRLETDDFNRSNGALGANWSQTFLSGSIMEIVSNEVRFPTDQDTHMMRRAESAFPDNHYAQAESQKATFYGDGIVPCVRMSSDGDGYCIGNWDTTNMDLREYADGVGTYLAEGSLVAVVGTYYTLRVTATGTTLTAAQEGSTIVNTTDGTLTTGKPGIKGDVHTSPATAFALDDFESTEETAGAPFPAAIINGLLKGGGVRRWR